ncbi:microtubule organization protein AKNA isoform X2 [Etheostoma spectabile]|uniref:microtubule organization protein AKNA isoform X2 n=1 Tax=Etheostoma spectabile TaxID=54343 RepID=UPI0013AF67F7|nr:microtubule organization protein AKNA-like isoform X2 [Etheostoma spectabile]
MEGEPEESEEDVKGEDKPTVLWEKSIQQSIFVDLSEDESLHLSDLESSLAFHLSQAESAASEASIHLSGSAELSALEYTSSESSIVRSPSEKAVESKSSILHVSAQRPNTIQDEPPFKQHDDVPEQDTSDEDQDDLPYDGDLGSPYFNQAANSEGNMSSDGREIVHASSDVPALLECNTRDKDDIIEHLGSVECNAEKPASLSQEDGHTKQDSFFYPSKPIEGQPCPSDINQLLLRHFSQEELLWSGRLIEAETLPEVSLLESVDYTVFSCATAHSSIKVNDNQSESDACNSQISQVSFGSDRTNEKCTTPTTISSLDEEAEMKIDNGTSTASDSFTSSSASIHSEQGSRNPSAAEKQENPEEDDQIQRVPLLRTRSFSEIKYGQGQVHYPLPDFSKIAPKVKIPKAPSGPVRSVPQSPTAMHRAQSSPGMLEVINRVLEDSVHTSEQPYVFRDEDKKSAPALVHHLQAEYDKLLTKYAEAENLIDQMRIGTNAQPSSELMLYLECADNDHQGNLIEGGHLGCVAPRIPPSENLAEKQETISRSNIKEVNTASSSQPEEGPSEGERMTAELTGIISQFMQKVEEFKLIVSNMSVSIAEQQMMLRSIMEAQDQLEREYISKKEEHRALEMQNYMGLSRNTGTFDPNRLIEGDIFRIGMHLEDIKEMIDKNVCEQISPPHSSSTPTSMEEMLHVKPSPLCMPALSPPPSLHEGPSAGFSHVGYKTEGRKEDENTEEVEEAIEVHGDEELQQRSELTTTDSLLKKTGHRHCHSRSSQGSVEGLGIQTAGAEEERSSVSLEVIDNSNILAYLSGSSSSLRQRQWTPNSRSTPDSVLNPAGECDLGDCVSPAVEVSSSSDARRDSDSHIPSKPPLDNSSVSQRILSPETDSGFGSSYLNQSASGPFHPNLLTESVHSQNEALSSSDSDGSCSNLQTAVHSAFLTSQRWASPHPSVQTQSCGAAAAVERWVESTTKEPSVRLQGSEHSPPAQLHHHVSEPALSTTMDTEERGSPLYSCSCNSEALLALQSEVSRLKKELEEGLVQLPHLAQKMDYLTSKYRQDCQERKSKTRPRTHHRPAYNSVWKPSSGSTQDVSDLSSSQVRIEDWISSDMGPSKSKGSEGNSSVKTSRLNSSILKGGKACDSHAKQRLQTAVTESFYSKERWSLFSSASLQKPLLQVSYGSSSSLPASYKVREPPLQSVSHPRKHSTQSDSALLPSNVYFQRTPSPVSVPSKTGSRTGRRRGTKEEDMNRTLDQAIEVARSMKRTTDRMAKRLSADLSEAQVHRKHYSMQPPGGRKHHA